MLILLLLFLKLFSWLIHFSCMVEAFYCLGKKMFCLRSKYFPWRCGSPGSQQGLFKGTFVRWVASVRGFSHSLRSAQPWSLCKKILPKQWASFCPDAWMQLECKWWWEEERLVGRILPAFERPLALSLFLVLVFSHIPWTWLSRPCHSSCSVAWAASLHTSPGMLTGVIMGSYFDPVI